MTGLPLVERVETAPTVIRARAGIPFERRIQQ